jgi:hypothetical protein
MHCATFGVHAAPAPSLRQGEEPQPATSLLAVQRPLKPGRLLRGTLPGIAQIAEITLSPSVTNTYTVVTNDNFFESAQAIPAELDGNLGCVGIECVPHELGNGPDRVPCARYLL